MDRVALVVTSLYTVESVQSAEKEEHLACLSHAAELYNGNRTRRNIEMNNGWHAPFILPILVNRQRGLCHVPNITVAR